MPASLRTLPRRVFDGFGYATRSESIFAEPTCVDELRDLYTRASEEGIQLAQRGSGRSYGDAAMNRDGLILDLRKFNRMLSFDAEDGVAEVEPGFTIEDLWRLALPHGFWPRVVPGTMFPTLGGCAAMNIHGKNHYQTGGFGDAVEETDLLTPTGELLTLSKDQNRELFHAAISGFGMLGSFTRIKLNLKRIHGGRLKVRQIYAHNLDEHFELFEEFSDNADYVVGWVDCIAGGQSSGRGQIHLAHYTAPGEDPEPHWLDPEEQALPATILGVPRGLVGMLLAILQGNTGMQLVNMAKSLASRFGPKAPHYQGHVAFHFLLDYVPTFREAYRPGGLIQYQPFVPAENARRVFGEILRRSRARGIVSYLGVMKRYRTDDFLLSHALDGYSLAMDFPVTSANRADLWMLCDELSDLVLEAGGKFYPAKDSVMRPGDFVRSNGESAVEAFRNLRRRCDPESILRSEFSDRIGLGQVG